MTHGNSEDGPNLLLGPAGPFSFQVAALRPFGTVPAARFQSSSRNTCSSRGGRAHPLAARLIPNSTRGARAPLEPDCPNGTWSVAPLALARPLARQMGDVRFQSTRQIHPWHAA